MISSYDLPVFAGVRMLEEKLCVGDEGDEVGGGSDQRMEGSLERGVSLQTKLGIHVLPIHFIWGCLIGGGAVIPRIVYGRCSAYRFPRYADLTSR